MGQDFLDYLSSSRLQSAIKVVSPLESRVLGTFDTPLDSRGLGTFDYLRCIDRIDEVFLSLRQAFF
jgi:hypothetical protein